jgi:hypothetical protein
MVQWIKHMNNDIILISYKGIHDEKEYLKAIKEATEFSVRAGEGVKIKSPKSLLLLVDITDSVLTIKIVETLKASANQAKPYCRKMAVVGVDGIKKILLNSVNRFARMDIRAIDDMLEAQNWLVE